MKMIFKQMIVCFLLFMMGGTCSLQADNNHPNNERKTQCASQGEKGPRDFKPEQFRRDLMAFVSRAAGFTAEESKVYFPLFFEMKDKQRSIEHQKGHALRQAARKNMNERDCQRVLREMAALNAKSQRIEKQFMDQMQKRLGAKKLVKAINADRDFGRNLFRKMTK